ncbi:alpha/beta hydrolase [Kribbella amoyensis]|nr:alpha/beta hydrolase [Kribbella amoyensis]
MRPTFRRLLAATTATALVVPITSASASGTSRAVPSIAWGSCGDAPAVAAFQCASVEVPTDYDRPGGATTTIALTRLPASDPARRIGSLFTNPGGPGGSGVAFVQQYAASYRPEVRARFDIVGFDPRGVGKSDPVTCFPTAAEELAAVKDLPAFPMTRAEVREFTRTNARIGLGCATTSPDRVAHYSTANVARDMDLLRQAVGDEKLSYVGYSYGTFLGATYAKLFPDNVRALALDGTWRPDAYSGSAADSRPVGERLGQTTAGAEVFAQFKAECAKAGPSGCALAGLGDPGQVAERLLERLKTQPVDLTLPDGSQLRVTYALMVATIFSTLYTPADWPDLAALMAQLAAPSKRTLKASTEGAKLLGQKEEYASVGGSLQPCVEARQTGRPLAYQAYADAADRAAPHFGRLRVWTGLMCEFQPIRDTDAFRGPWTKLEVDEPVLVIGTRYDPATPYEHTRPYADLYRDGRLLTVNGWGHTTIGKSSCADSVLTRYLVELKAPVDGTSCAQDRRPFG